LPEIDAQKYMVNAGWDHAPHLTEEQKRHMEASTHPHLRKARAKGIPVLGSGAIYPVDEDEVVVKPFDLPDYWPRVYGMDVGWNRTAAIWGAYDRQTDIIYLYSEHYRGQAEPAIHGTAIKARGDWIPGVIDPASRQRGQKDGDALINEYEREGLILYIANNAKEAGLLAVWQRLSVGRLKVFHTLQNWLDEYRIYQRDENGKVVEKSDHLMDATRYLVMSGIQHAKHRPMTTAADNMTTHAGMGDSVAGY